MLLRPFFIWLPRLLWRITLALSALLVLLVVLAPWLDTGEHPLMTLFAKDQAVRRISLASARGRAAPASIFFRPYDYRAAAERNRPPIHRRPPPSGAGA